MFNFNFRHGIACVLFSYNVSLSTAGGITWLKRPKIFESLFLLYLATFVFVYSDRQKQVDIISERIVWGGNYIGGNCLGRELSGRELSGEEII